MKGLGKSFDSRRNIVLVLALSMFGAMIPIHVSAADNEFVGTYKLVVEQRTIVDSGEIVPVKNPQGYITYSNDGRMIVLIVRNPRPKPESIEETTDQQRADLFRTMTAYGGTYKFDGSTIEHHIDISWNEVWTGTTQVKVRQKRGGPPCLHDASVSFSHRRQNERQHLDLGKGKIESLGDAKTRDRPCRHRDDGCWHMAALPRFPAWADGFEYTR